MFFFLSSPPPSLIKWRKGTTFSMKKKNKRPKYGPIFSINSPFTNLNNVTFRSVVLGQSPFSPCNNVAESQGLSPAISANPVFE